MSYHWDLVDEMSPKLREKFQTVAVDKVGFWQPWKLVKRET